MSEAPDFRIGPLDANKRRREDFDCGVEALTPFLRQRARKEMESRACA